MQRQKNLRTGEGRRSGTGSGRSAKADRLLRVGRQAEVAKGGTGARQAGTGRVGGGALRVRGGRTAPRGAVGGALSGEEWSQTGDGWSGPAAVPQGAEANRRRAERAAGGTSRGGRRQRRVSKEMLCTALLGTWGDLGC
jgi:hypothetical protein